LESVIRPEGHEVLTFFVARDQRCFPRDIGRLLGRPVYKRTVLDADGRRSQFLGNLVVQW
jgi:hypothetical protein